MITPFRKFLVQFKYLPKFLRSYQTQSATTHSETILNKNQKESANPLRGSVKYYKQHLFVCHGSDPSTWPSHIEKMSGFVSELIKQANNLKIPTRVNLCDHPSTCDFDSFDILYFSTDQSQNSIFRNVNLFNLPHLIRFLENNLISNNTTNKEQTEIHCEVLSPNVWIFVCCHQSRDERCGRCGPPLVESIQRYLTKVNSQYQGKQQAIVRRTSHVGGHEWAGNVIVYPQGDWYGYVTPQNVERILDHYFEKNVPILEDHWRGRIGLTKEQQQQQQ